MHKVSRNSNLLLFVFAMIFLLSSCVGIQNPRTKRVAAPTTTDGPTTSIIDPDFSNLNETYWFSSNQIINGTITINADIKTVIYLRGKEIHDFLKVSTNYLGATNRVQEYCMIATYTDPKAKPQLRVRAIPLTVKDTTKGTTEYYFRIDLTSAALNESYCSNSSAIETIAGKMNHEATYSPLTLCSGASSCVTSVTSTAINFFKIEDQKISDSTVLSSLDLDLAGMALQVDLTSGTYNQATSCTENQCKILGYNCCIEGQCVFDGTVRPNVSTHANYTSAMQSYETNPQTFQNYPEIFYVCGNNAPSVPPTPTAIPNVDEVVLKEFEQKKLDLTCIESGLSTPPVYTSCTRFDTAGPWTVDDYIAVRNDVWERCGCQDKPFPTDPELLACPNFGLEATYAADGVTITAVNCKVPLVDVEPTPIVDHTLTIGGRIAPHRFFATDGTSIDYVTATTDTTLQQEGTEFFYQNPATSYGPETGSFSMNTILGQLGLTLTLGKALPAVTIPIEYDTLYIIKGNGGYYTPCPTCVPDNWSDGLYSAHPKNLANGNGLTSVGYATRRDSGDYATNATMGNYEDTKFGRACFVPPTMIPFSHKANSDVQTQRLNRLDTQATYFSNGYQRDWYGFNKGALIGSFDGVHWFPIGSNGRRIRSNSNKLFLAINAPFADLAGTSSVTVSIYSSMVDLDTVADVDYNPDLPTYHPNQNWAATCQKWHQCETDSDCITQLGWEYSCADISKVQFYTPKFSSTAEETANLANVAKFVNDKFLSVATQGDSKKRCVYRGAGAPCKKNYDTNVSVPTNEDLFRCAPNFYCAGLDTNSFNDSINRDPIPLSSIMYGFASPTLGRPESYIDATDFLTTSIKDNIKANLGLNTSTTTDFGICRPGRSISSTNVLTTHQAKDTAGRTDFISQIGACDSTKTSASSVSACPIIDDEGNISDTYSSTLAIRQNSCGSQAINESDENVFSTIEAINLRNLFSLTTPSVALNACLRRAGSVCNTDLDCGPNRLHAAVAALNGIEAFGGTYAEKYYWEEYLVCGQAQKKPVWSDWNWGDYDITENRCCRPQGEKLTIYTNGKAELMNDIYEDEVLPDTSSLQTIEDPSAARRYSRYSSIYPLVTVSAPATPVYQVPNVTGTGTTLPYKYQWKTIHDTAKNTCCGGGFVRTFYDGTHDWTNLKRFNIDYENFACLNYKSELHNLDSPESNNLNANNYSMYSNQHCRYPTVGGCNQIEFDLMDTYAITNPTDVSYVYHSLTFSNGANTRIADSTEATLMIHPGMSYSTTTGATPDLNEMMMYLTPDAPFLPTVIMPSTSSNPYPFPHGLAGTVNRAVSFYLPSYISPENITDVDVFQYSSNSTALTTVDIDFSNECNTLTSLYNPTSFGSDLYCVETYNGYTIFHMKLNGGSGSFDHGAIRLKFKPMNSVNYFYTSGSTATTSGREALTRGNPMYYLTKLGRFELSGIPQIFYEPLVCNDNRSNIVPGLFNTEADTKASFDSAAVNLAVTTNLSKIYNADTTLDTAAIAALAVDTANSTKSVVFGDKLLNDPIFRSSEFTCCLELGQRTSDASSCCSNYYGVNSEGNNVCMLPAGANLNVYFNRFVSGDGMGEDQPGGGLTDDDFIPETGEPKLQATTYDKLAALGAEYCINQKVKKGSAFGKYPTAAGYTQEFPDDAEDGAEDYFSIVDQSTDHEKAGSSLEEPRSVTYFRAGYRWNHHYYCSP